MSGYSDPSDDSWVEATMRYPQQLCDRPAANVLEENFDLQATVDIIRKINQMRPVLGEQNLTDFVGVLFNLVRLVADSDLPAEFRTAFGAKFHQLQEGRLLYIRSSGIRSPSTRLSQGDLAQLDGHSSSGFTPPGKSTSGHMHSAHHHEGNVAIPRTASQRDIGVMCKMPQCPRKKAYLRIRGYREHLVLRHSLTNDQAQEIAEAAFAPRPRYLTVTGPSRLATQSPVQALFQANNNGLGGLQNIAHELNHTTDSGDGLLGMSLDSTSDPGPSPRFGPNPEAKSFSVSQDMASPYAIQSLQHDAYRLEFFDYTHTEEDAI